MADQGQSDGHGWWTPFRKGALAGALVILLAWGAVWWIQRGVYACVAWGHKGELVACRVAK